MFYLIGLGSNIRADEHMDKAIAALQALGTLYARSDRIATQAVGETFHADFKNQLLVLQCNDVAPVLKQKLLRIESQLGREGKSPGRKSRDRTIDIDIITNAESLEACCNIKPEESYYQRAAANWHQLSNV